MEAQAAGRIHPLKVCVTVAAVVNPGCALTDFTAEVAGSPSSDAEPSAQARRLVEPSQAVNERKRVLIPLGG